MNAKSTTKDLKSRTNLKKVHQEDDSDIDYSDTPSTTEEFWADAEEFMPSHKVHVSMRLDDEIIAFFKKSGRGYQSKINAVLKAYVRSHSKRRENSAFDSPSHKER